MDIQEHMIQFSLQDTIGILDASPAKADLILEVTVIQVMNRVPIAHLAIERTLKFLIHAAGGNFEETHTLNRHREALEEYDPDAEDFLSRAFDEAVRFYNYNTNVNELKHLRSLNQYFQETGTDDAFQKMRYWELGQSLEDVLIRRVNLRIHREILFALQQLLIRSDKYVPKTITHRVDALIKQPIWVNLGPQPGTPRERAVKSLLRSHSQGKSWRSILRDAVQSGFDLGDGSLNKDILEVYKQLLQSDDPAVRYHAEMCVVLPRQPRDGVPDVKWVVQNQYGEVHTPMGTILGLIERGPDGFWSATSFTNFSSVRTESQTDARAYLGSLMSSLATIVVEDKVRQLRIVGEVDDALKAENDTRWTDEYDPEQPATFNLEFWDANHGLDVNQAVEIELATTYGDLHQLKGRVVSVQYQNVTVAGSDVFATLGESYLTERLKNLT